MITTEDRIVFKKAVILKDVSKCPLNPRKLPKALVTLLIPKGTEINEPTGQHRKARAQKAIVIRIEDENGKNIKEAHAFWPFWSWKINGGSRPRKESFYRVGKKVSVKGFECGESCEPGIHFFDTKEQALNYQFN